MRQVSARSLWIRILTARIETGEPYLVFSDHVNNARPEHQKLAGLEVKTSNLCSEITLPTGIDQHGQAADGGVLLVVAEPRDLVRVERPSAVHRGRHAVPRQRAAGLHRPRATGDGAGAVFGGAGALGGLGGDGVPQLPAGAERAVRGRGREGVEQADVQAYPGPGGPGEPDAGRGARRLPGRGGVWHRRAVQQQDGDRADGQHQHHHGQHEPGDRADCGQRVPAEDAVGQLRGAEPAFAAACWR